MSYSQRAAAGFLDFHLSQPQQQQLNRNDTESNCSSTTTNNSRRKSKRSKRSGDMEFYQKPNRAYTFFFDLKQQQEDGMENRDEIMTKALALGGEMVEEWEDATFIIANYENEEYDEGGTVLTEKFIEDSYSKGTWISDISSYSLQAAASSNQPKQKQAPVESARKKQKKTKYSDAELRNLVNYVYQHNNMSLENVDNELFKKLARTSGFEGRTAHGLSSKFSQLKKTNQFTTYLDNSSNNPIVVESSPPPPDTPDDSNSHLLDSRMTNNNNCCDSSILDSLIGSISNCDTRQQHQHLRADYREIPMQFLTQPSTWLESNCGEQGANFPNPQLQSQVPTTTAAVIEASTTPIPPPEVVEKQTNKRQSSTTPKIHDSILLELKSELSRDQIFSFMAEIMGFPCGAAIVNDKHY